MHELGFTESFLKWYFPYQIWNMFRKWMYGQTVAIIEGECVYYFCDVRTFCSSYGIEYPRLPEAIKNWEKGTGQV